MSEFDRNKSISICRADSIAENSARGFTLQTCSGPRKIFIANSGNGFFAYENSCPHTGVNLDWTADEFLDDSNSLIQCATHGALFRIIDGLCIFGPCANQSLTRIAIQINDGVIFVIF